jgi:hypothetical protein
MDGRNFYSRKLNRYHTLNAEQEGAEELSTISMDSTRNLQQSDLIDLINKHEKSINSLRTTNISLTAVNILVFLVVVLIGGGSIVWNGWQESVIQSNSHNLDIVEDEVDELIECTGEFCEDPDIFKNITSVIGTVNELVNCTEPLCDNPDIFEEIADNFTTINNDFTTINNDITVINNDINTLETCTQPLCDNPEILNNLTIDVTVFNETLNELLNCTEVLCDNPGIFTEISNNFTALDNAIGESGQFFPSYTDIFGFVGETPPCTAYYILTDGRISLSINCVLEFDATAQQYLIDSISLPYAIGDSNSITGNAVGTAIGAGGTSGAMYIATASAGVGGAVLIHGTSDTSESYLVSFSIQYNV